MKINLIRFSGLFTWLFRTWTRLIRYDDQGQWQPIVDAAKAGIPTVIAMWHNELFALSGFGARQDCSYVIIISQSKDGEIIARILDTFGHISARGSSSRGGIRALLTAAREMKKNGRTGVFTVDGPRGPRHEIKEGLIFLAQRAGALVFPIRAFAAKKIVFEKSWDHFEVPWPLSRCNIRVGEPFRITQEKLKDEVMEREKQRVKDALDAVQEG